MCRVRSQVLLEKSQKRELEEPVLMVSVTSLGCCRSFYDGEERKKQEVGNKKSCTCVRPEHNTRDGSLHTSPFTHFVPSIKITCVITFTQSRLAPGLVSLCSHRYNSLHSMTPVEEPAKVLLAPSLVHICGSILSQAYRSFRGGIPCMRPLQVAKEVLSGQKRGHPGY